MFAELFRRRLDGDDIKATRALEQNFANPRSEMEERIKVDIDAYRATQVSKWEKDLFVQKMRLADAERSHVSLLRLEIQRRTKITNQTQAGGENPACEQL
jgi:hypothetical protein